MDAQQASDNMNVDSQQNTNALSKEDTGEMNVPNSTTENKADNTQVNDSYSNTNMEEIYAMKDCPIITDNIKDMSIEEMRKTLHQVAGLHNRNVESSIKKGERDFENYCKKMQETDPNYNEFMNETTKNQLATVFKSSAGKSIKKALQYNMNLAIEANKKIQQLSGANTPPSFGGIGNEKVLGNEIVVQHNRGDPNGNSSLGKRSRNDFGNSENRIAKKPAPLGSNDHNNRFPGKRFFNTQNLTNRNPQIAQLLSNLDEI